MAHNEPNSAEFCPSVSDYTQQNVQGELTALLFAQLPRSVTASLLLAGLTLIVVRHDAIGMRLNWWFAGMAVVSAARYSLAWYYQDSEQPQDRFWTRIYTLLASGSGAIWASLLLTQATGGSSASVVYCAVVLGGVCAAAMTTMAYYPKAYIYFITPPLSGFAAWAVLGVEPPLPGLAFATCVYFGLLVSVGRSFYGAHEKALRLGFERQRLLDRLKDKHTRLREAQDILLHEQHIAANVMASIVEPQTFETCGLKVHIQPLNQFDGDLLLSGTSDDKALRVLLGDATGHGLSAAIAAIPAAQTFRAMTRKARPCTALIRELNANTHRLLPRNIYLAAALIELSPRSDGGCDLLVWNGGLDDLLVVRENGSLERICSRNLALGILDPDTFAPTFESIILAPADRLYAYTDGLTESADGAGQLFGRSRLEAALLKAPDANSRIDYILAQHRAFIASVPLRDDLTLIELQPDAIAESLSSVSRSDTGDRYQDLARKDCQRA